MEESLNKICSISHKCNGKKLIKAYLYDMSEKKCYETVLKNVTYINGWVNAQVWARKVMLGYWLEEPGRVDQKKGNGFSIHVHIIKYNDSLIKRHASQRIKQFEELTEEYIKVRTEGKEFEGEHINLHISDDQIEELMDRIKYEPDKIKHIEFTVNPKVINILNDAGIHHNLIEATPLKFT